MAEEKAAKKNVSHEMIIWKQLIETELKTASNWEAQWGFLKGERKLSSRMHGSASAPSLNVSATQMQTSTFRIPAKKDRSAQLLSRLLESPQQRYGRPLITSHEIGWRPSIERFGVSHHGVKRDPGIWPDY